MKSRFEARLALEDAKDRLRDLDPEFIAEIKKVTCVVTWDVPMKNGRLMPRNYKQHLIWTERDGTKTPIPKLRTRHLHLILLKMEIGWRDENKAGIWRMHQTPYLLEEFEYRKRLDNNPVIT